MGDVPASKGERDRSHIATQDKAEVRRWLRHFGVPKNELKLAVDKVGNSVVAVRKQMGLDCKTQPLRERAVYRQLEWLQALPSTIPFLKHLSRANQIDRIGMSAKKALRPGDRASALTLKQTMKMARSAHAYVRGSTVQFYEWLEAQKRGTLPEGPAVWICGDCHSGNLGPVAGVDGRVAIQIRDLDQSVIGNPVHDLIRLALSLATASRGSDLPGVTTARILEQVIEGYQAALRQDADTIDDAPKSIQFVMKKSVARSWKHLANERLENKKPTIPLGTKFWALSRSEKLISPNCFRLPPCAILPRRCVHVTTMPQSKCWTQPIG